MCSPSRGNTWGPSTKCGGSSGSACWWQLREMSAISRKLPTPLRNCCKTSSENKGAPAAWCMASQACRSVLRSSWKSFSRWWHEKRTSRGASNLLSHHIGGWCFDLLQGGWLERRTDASLVARTAVFLADVRATIRAAVRSLSPRRARLPGLRTQRLAGPETIRVHVRSLRRDHESLHGGAGAPALHVVHAGLRGPCRFSHGASPSGPDRGLDRPGRGGAQRRSGGELEDATGLLGRWRRQRDDPAHPPAVAGPAADARRRQRS